MSNLFQDSELDIWDFFNQSGHFGNVSPQQGPYDTLSNVFAGNEGYNSSPSLSPQYHTPPRDRSPLMDPIKPRNPMNPTEQINSPPRDQFFSPMSQQTPLYSTPIGPLDPYLSFQSANPPVPPVPLLSPGVQNQLISPHEQFQNFPYNRRNFTPCPESPVRQVRLPDRRRGHNSTSHLVRRLEPLSCVFIESWVAVCESLDTPGVDTVEVVVKLIQLEKIRQKKPEELKSIMRETLTPEQQNSVLSARKKKMRKNAKKERTLSHRRRNFEPSCTSGFVPMLPPMAPPIEPLSHVPVGY